MLVLVHDLHGRVLAEQGEQLRRSLLDPTRDYQRQAKPWMFRDICARCPRHRTAPPAGFEPATRCLEGSRSIPLSYRGSKIE